MASSVQVLLPPPALRVLAICAVRREMAGCTAEAAGIHANSYACLSVIVRGEVQAASGGLPKRFLNGPFTRPVATLARGPLLSLSLVLQPWLLPSLAGKSAEAMVDRIDDVSTAGGAVQMLCEAAAVAARDPSQAHVLWQALERVLPRDAFAVPERLALRRLEQQGPGACARALGLSERHYRRVFVEHMGLAPKLWQRTRRFEQALQAMGSPAPADPATAPAGLGELALQAGFADQPHMNREFRALLEQAPRGARSALQGEGDTSWALQPARVRFVQDDTEPGS